MDINKINAVNPSVPSDSRKRVEVVSDHASKAKDSVSLSHGGKMQSLYKRAMDVIVNTPDIRAEKVALAKANLESYANLSDEALTDLAGRVLKDLGLSKRQ